MQKIISIIFLIVGLFFVIHFTFFTFFTTEVLDLLDYIALLYCGMLSFFISNVLWSSK